MIVSKKSMFIIVLFILILSHTKPLSADWVVYQPPDGYDNISTWGVGPGIADWRHSANITSGGVSALAAAWAGAASGQAMVKVDIPNITDPVPIRVEATITYIEGTINYGFGSFSGTRLAYGANGSIHYQDLEYGLSFANIFDKIIAVAALFTYTTPPASWTIVNKVMDFVDFINDLNDYATLASGLAELTTQQVAKTKKISFTFIADPAIVNTVSIGVRADAAGALTGTGFAMVTGQVEEIKIYKGALNGEWIPIPTVSGQWIPYDMNGDDDTEDWWDYALKDNVGLGHIGIYHPYYPTPADNYIYRHRNGSTPPDDHLILNNALDYPVYEDEYFNLNYSSSDLTALDNEGTFEAWVKPMDTELFRGHVIYTSEGGTTPDGWGGHEEIHLSLSQNGQFAFYIGGTDGNPNINLYSGVDVVYELNERYYHIAGTYLNCGGSLTAYLYVDGVEVNGGFSDNSASINLSEIMLGRCSSYDNPRYFYGKMKGIKVYRRMLSSREVRVSYWKGGGDTGNPTTPVIAEEPDYSPATANLISWEASTDDISGVAYYNVKCMDNSKALVAQDTTESTSYIFENLQNGVEYTYQVAAIDSAGNSSSWSASVTSIQDTLPPISNPVIETEPVNTGGLYNRLSWSTTTDALSDSVYYLIQCADDTEFDSLNSNFFEESDWLSDSLYTFTDLSGYITYYYRVKAADKAGNETAWSDTIFSFQDASAPTMNFEPKKTVGLVNNVSWSPPVGAGGGKNQTTYLVQCSDNKDFGSKSYFSESGWSADNNTFYLNTLYNNNENVSIYNSSGNTWCSPTNLSYIYGGSSQTYKSNMGNFYDDYAGSDTDGDGIGDTYIPYTTGGANDNYPLADTLGNFDLQTWWLADTVMWRGDMSKSGITVTINASSSHIWLSDQATLTNINFAAGDSSAGTSWTGLLSFTSTPGVNDIKVQIGYSTDGTDFIPGGPETTIGGSSVLTFATSAQSFTIPTNKYLAVKIKNQGATDLKLRVGGSCSYISAPEGSQDFTLPVELSSFTAVYTKNESGNDFVTVKWDTASETDVIGFNIYRSEYNDIGTVGNHINSYLIPGHGSTSDPHSYLFEDLTADVHIPYNYWLEVADFGGISEYYGPIKYIPGDIDGDQVVDVYNATKLFSNYPNPAKNLTTIKYQLKGSGVEQDASIRIYNILGELVKIVKGKKGKAELDVSDLATGIYLYQLKTTSYNEVKKLIIVR